MVASTVLQWAESRQGISVTGVKCWEHLLSRARVEVACTCDDKLGSLGISTASMLQWVLTTCSPCPFPTASFLPHVN